MRGFIDGNRVRQYFTCMKTTISTKGQIVLPAEFRQRDGVEPGREFEFERIDRGEYLSIDHIGGYASIFGDEARMRLDLCQHCVKELLLPSARFSEPKETVGRFCF